MVQFLKPKDLGECEIVDIVQETHDTYSFTFDISHVEDFEYYPGQFVMLHPIIDGKPLPRAYSLASTPTQPGKISTTIKAMNGGKVSNYMNNDVKVGTKMHIKGPFGHFFFHEDDIQTPVVLIGAGSGMTPFKGITQYIIDKKLDNKLTILSSHKTPEDMIYHDFLSQCADTYANIEAYFTITRPEGAVWDGLTGRISAEMLKEIIPNMEAPHYFICGPLDMVNGVVEILEGLGVQKSKIKTEKYG